jgi:Baseplate J-like protein
VWKVKKFRDILGDMASWISISNSKITNFTVGSVIRSLLEAVAMELEDLYHFIRAKFEQLQDNAIYSSFGFGRRPAMPATGYVTVRFTQPLTQSVLFEEGYRFYTIPLNGTTIYFKSTKPVTATVGLSEIDIMVECEQGGLIGNVPAFSITRVVNSTPFLAGVFNKDKFFTGLPEETKEERQKRFNAFVGSLGRASNPALVYGCMQVPVDKSYPGVAGVYIKEDIGIIYVYAHDSFGDLPAQMKTDLENQLFQYKAGGIKSIVSGVTRKDVNLNIKVLVAEGYTTSSILYKVEEEVTVYLNKLVVSKPLIRADLIRFIMDVDKEAIENISIDLNSDIVIQPQELLRPGTITVTEME